MFCLIVNEVYEWQVTKTNSCARSNVTGKEISLHPCIIVSLYPCIFVSLFQLEKEHREELTPLVLACVMGTKNRQVVTTLLELGANVNHGLPPFKTPLVACMQG